MRQTNLLGIRTLEGPLYIDFLPCLHKMILYFASGRFCDARDIRLVALILPSLSFQTKALRNRSAELSCRGDRSRIDPDRLDAQIRIKGQILSHREPFSNVEVRLLNLNKHSCGSIQLNSSKLTGLLRILRFCSIEFNFLTLVKLDFKLSTLVWSNIALHDIRMASCMKLEFPIQ